MELLHVMEIYDAHLQAYMLNNLPLGGEKQVILRKDWTCLNFKVDLLYI